MEKNLPPIPAKRYFTIGEVSELCGVKPYVLRYWEQEFTQLKPMKRRGNRRYYQHHEVLLIRRIRELLYEQGFTISGARNRLTDAAADRSENGTAEDGPSGRLSKVIHARPAEASDPSRGADDVDGLLRIPLSMLSTAQVRQELLSIRGLLCNDPGPPDRPLIIPANGA
ncbi:MAG: MerR family transcriptional regulator [Pseudomonadota bacterium]|nr:MerR family transcriptional regulator [Pseudomonadota bacterium]